MQRGSIWRTGIRPTGICEIKGSAFGWTLCCLCWCNAPQKTKEVQWAENRYILHDVCECLQQVRALSFAAQCAMTQDPLSQLRGQHRLSLGAAVEVEGSHLTDCQVL